MGWAVGFDSRWQRDIGYGVPAICDHPDCKVEIDRGLAYVCGGQPYGGEKDCGLYFCEKHLSAMGQKCDRCCDGNDPYEPKPDLLEWINWKLSDESWETWRIEHPKKVAEMQIQQTKS